jgi:hypothetical protein
MVEPAAVWQLDMVTVVAMFPLASFMCRGQQEISYVNTMEVHLSGAARYLLVKYAQVKTLHRFIRAFQVVKDIARAS